MLKMTGVKLEKISDIDKYLFFEKGVRGGISYIAKRYAKANKPYLDMNNFYGWGLSSYLPYGGFKWLKYVEGLM